MDQENCGRDPVWLSARGSVIRCEINHVTKHIRILADT